MRTGHVLAMVLIVALAAASAARGGGRPRDAVRQPRSRRAERARRLTACSVVAAALALGVAACGSNGDEAASPAGTVQGTTAEMTTAETSTGPAQGATVAVRETSLGEILVDGDGLTLYLFLQDERGSGESTCSDACADAWPPLLTSEQEPSAGSGADADLLGTIGREDGSEQVTYDGWPLYYFASDEEPGDTRGQGVDGFGDTWWVVSPAGEPVMQAEGGGVYGGG